MVYVISRQSCLEAAQIICMVSALVLSACKHPLDLSFTERILVEWNCYTSNGVESEQIESQILQMWKVS